MKILNKERFDENFKLFDTETLDEIINIFKEEHTLKLKAIQEDLKSKNYEKLKFNLHSFKGVLSNFDTGKIYEIARTMEILAEQKRGTEIYSIFPVFVERTNLLIEDLNDIQQNMRKRY